MTPEGFVTIISAGERPQTYASGRRHTREAADIREWPQTYARGRRHTRVAADIRLRPRGNWAFKNYNSNYLNQTDPGGRAI